jgi:hypothetical protein
LLWLHSVVVLLFVPHFLLYSSFFFRLMVEAFCW